MDGRNGLDSLSFWLETNRQETDATPPGVPGKNADATTPAWSAPTTSAGPTDSTSRPGGRPTVTSCNWPRAASNSNHVSILVERGSIITVARICHTY